MKRDAMRQNVEKEKGIWDFVVIGGGASGLGAAVEAAARGYRTLLLEEHDFAKGTSSRSTKLVHGGVRYLQQGNISLVLEALHERGLMVQNAPHLVRHRAFIVPNYDWWEGPFYGIGLKVYDLLAGRLGLGPSKTLSREEVLEKIPTLEPEGLRGGVVYYDGQFDDARFAITLAQTVADLGGSLLNYMKVTGLLKRRGMTAGVTAVDAETNRRYDIQARVVVNATGVFADSVRRMDDPRATTIIAPSQGVHLVLDKSFLPGDSAIMVPHTDDGRVLFAVPWHDRVIVGTTDTPVEQPEAEPQPQKDEVDFILKHAAKYLTKDPQRSDVLSAFAGLRPLVRAGGNETTSALSRDHSVLVSSSGLVTISGGKWTTYRRMAEDTVDQAAMVACLDQRSSPTAAMRLHGWEMNRDDTSQLCVYGTDANAIRKLAQLDPDLAGKLHANLPYIKAEVVWAVRHEMARSLEDVLARRTRALLLDAQASLEAAPDVAQLMARELGRNNEWQRNELETYRVLAGRYRLV